MIQSLEDRVRLSDGKSMPGFGFGCYNAHGAEITNAVRMALENGYRYIDSAAMYKNESEVGQGIRDSGVPREKVFVLSKLWPTSYADVEKGTAEILENLGLEYVDCLLLHWPGRDEAVRLHAYEQLIAVREKGLAGSIGVSNFDIPMVEAVMKQFGETPVMDELEQHPKYQQTELVEFCHAHGMQTVAYSPIARGAYMDDPVVGRIAAAHGCTPTQVVLRWHIETGRIPIPKSTHENRIRENADVFGFSLTAEELASLTALECGGRTGQDYRTFPQL